MRLDSSWLRQFRYRISLHFDEALRSGKIIALADNQMLRLIRRLSGKQAEDSFVEALYEHRDRLQKQRHSRDNQVRIRYLKERIYDLHFIDAYVVVHMESARDYRLLFEKGLYINGKKYVRASCSAAQARGAKVVFCEENICAKLLTLLDNGRDKQVPFSPSKYNAYLGMASSATKPVSPPRIAVIPDCVKIRPVEVWWVEEQKSPDADDRISRRQVDLPFNLFDGSGLIRPEMAMQWAEELGLNYLPAQWCIRAPWIKGMVQVFDFEAFCRQENGGRYLIDSLYRDDQGRPAPIDVRDVDVILTESQFKLWHCYPDLETYVQNCRKNGLDWGVSLYTPEQDKEMVELNYQFIQTLDLDQDRVRALCATSRQALLSASGGDIWQTLLFLLGVGHTEESLQRFLTHSTQHWLRALVYAPELLSDGYLRDKIAARIKGRAQGVCMGKLLVEGNFQVIVPDPFAFMEHACGKEARGLLQPGCFYSRFWNRRQTKQIDCMRSPMTYLSEHLVVSLQKDARTETWYRFASTGILTNVHDPYTLRFSGSDFDYDILCTTNDPTVLASTYAEELPVVYQPPQAKKICFQPKDLYQADLFTFGSIIGRITNCATILRTRMADYPPGSPTYQLLLDRMRMSCKLQSAQIDKAKIGREVKGIPRPWLSRVTTPETAEGSERARLICSNQVVCDKHPYFFLYLYQQTRQKYRRWQKGFATASLCRFGVPPEKLDPHIPEQQQMYQRYRDSCPVIDNDAPMNQICHLMEDTLAAIKIRRRGEPAASFLASYRDERAKPYARQAYERIGRLVAKIRREFTSSLKPADHSGFDESLHERKQHLSLYYRETLLQAHTNLPQLVNMLVDLFYLDHPSYHKDLLWQMFGRELADNAARHAKTPPRFPFPDRAGEITYLGRRYTLRPIFSPPTEDASTAEKAADTSAAADTAAKRGSEADVLPGGAAGEGYVPATCAAPAERSR